MKKNYSNIAVDDRAESCRMAEYLLGLGHKQIALITENAEGESVGKLRLLGYQDALKEQGIAVNPKLILKITDDVFCIRPVTGSQNSNVFTHKPSNPCTKP